MGPRTGLDGCGKSRLHRDSIPGLGVTVQILVVRNLYTPSIQVNRDERESGIRGLTLLAQLCSTVGTVVKALIPIFVSTERNRGK